MQAKNNTEKQFIDELAELRRRNVELEQINNQFRQSEERFRLVSEAGGVGLFEWNATRDISYWSSQHYELTGFARGSSVNYEQWLSVVHPEDRERITEKVGVLLKQASTVQSPVIHKDEYRIIHPDKGLRWLESNFDTEMVQGEIIIRGTTRDISEHKEAQNILRRSEIFYRVLHENISDSFVQVDMNGNIIDFNDEYCQMLGYSPQEIRLLSYQELTPEPWHDMEAKIVREQIIPRGYSDIYEKEYRRKDGTIIPIELRTILIRNNQGDPESMWAIIRDISARKRLTESLKMRENRLSLALSAGKLATWDNNLQSGKTVWNDEHFHMMGYEVGEVEPSYKAFSDRVHPDDKNKCGSEFEKSIKNNEDYFVEFRTLWPDTTVRWIEAHGRVERDSENRPVRSYGVMADITERKRAEIALKESEKRYRSLFQNMTEGFFLAAAIYDDSGNPIDYRYLEINKAFEDLTGLRSENTIGRTVNEVLPGLEDIWIQKYGQVAFTGNPVTVENFALPLNRYYRTVAFSPQPGQFACIFNDITEQKQAEEKLRDSEQRLKFILNNSIDAIYQYNLQQDNYEYLSPAIEQLIGYSPDQVKGFNLNDIINLIHPEDVPLFTKEIEMTSSGAAETGIVEYRLLTKNGEYKWLADRFNLLRDDAGQPLYRVGVVRDVDDRKRAEEAFVMSRTELQSVINGAALIIYAFDLNGKFLFCNKAVGDLFDTPPEQMIGRTRHDFMPGETAAWHEANDRKVAEEGQAIEFEEYGPVGKDGRLITWLTTKFPLRDSRGKIYATAGMSTDITDRKGIEDNIRQSRNELEQRVLERTSELENERRLLQTIFDNIPVMLALHTKDRDVPLINKEIERLTGWSQYDLDSIDLMAELYPDPEYRKQIWEHMGNPGLSWKDIRMKTRDGRLLETRWMNVPLNDSSQIGIGLDMTEINHLQNNLRQTQKMEAIGTLAGGIAHDFNNILAAILGFTEMAIEDASDYPGLHRTLGNIHTAAIRARDLVKQILTFSRKGASERHPVSLSETIQETVNLLRASIPATIDIMVNLDATSDTILASSVEIQQILMNLASNAALAMEIKGGQLDIILSDTDVLPDDFKSGKNPADYIKLTVKDTGIGMKPEVIDRMFDPFFTTRNPGQGIGMGLPVVYGIVNNLQGAITVQSKPGVGTRFDIFLPTMNVTAKTKPRHSGSPVGTENILFIDDEDLLVEWAKATLERLGYSVTAFNSPNSALKTFADDPSSFDLVITDQSMPSLSGLELSQKLLKLRPDIPIILCTGHSATVSRKIAKKAGIATFLMKPISRPELAKAIRKALDKKTL